MSRPPQLNPTVEIGHVLVVEIAEYAKLSIEDLNQQVLGLQQSIRNTREVQRAQADGDLVQLRLPSGVALIFQRDPASPLKCAYEIAINYKSQIRTGIHSGPINRFSDKVDGEGVSYAEAVMDCGDTGHILMSKTTADVIPCLNELKGTLHELGSAETESGLHLHLFNCFTDGAGNPEVPSKVCSQVQITSFANHRYRPLEKLGEGGMGVVYLAEDTLLDRRVALKLLTARRDDEHYRSRFFREARAASKLNHPNIATIYDYGTTTDEKPFIVLELVSGKTLDTLLEAGPLTLERGVEVVESVADALAEAHKHGVIHRDIKPSNVAVTDSGKVKVLDFGLAKQVSLTDSSQFEAAASKQTLPGMLIGTPLYMSPEQAKGLDLDARSDLFALGSLLYECLTGRAAFAAEGAIEICTRIIHSDPQPPSEINPRVPPELDRITLKALAKEPAARYQSAEDMRGDLNQVLSTIRAGEGARTKMLPAKSDSVWKGIKQVLTRPNLGLVLALVVIGLSAWATSRYWWPRSSPVPNPAAKNYYDRGLQSLHDGSYLQASKMLEEAVKTDKTFVLAHARLAEAYMELDMTDRARQEMLSAEEGRDNLSDADQLRLTAIKATVQRDFPKAVAAYLSLQQQSADQRGIHVDLGRAYERNYEFEKALASYERATQVNSQDAAAYVHLGRLYGRKREPEKALAAFATAESLYDITSNSEGKTEVLYERGYFYNRVSKYKEARPTLELALATAKESGYQKVRIMMEQSLTACIQGELDQSMRTASQAVELARNRDFDVLTAQALIALGRACYCAGRNDEAQQKYEEGLSLAQRHEALATEAKARLSLGSLYSAQGKTDEALQNVEAALALFEKLAGNSEAEMSAQAVIGRVQTQKGNYQMAADAFSDLLTRAQPLKDIDHVALAHEGLGSVMILKERYPEALTHFQASLSANESKKDQLGIGFSLSNCASALWRLGRYEEANRMFEHAATIARRSKEEYKNMLLAIQLNRMEALLSQRQFAAVLTTSAEVIARTDKQMIEPVIRAKRGSALAKLDSGKLSEARKLAEEAVAQAIDLGDPALLYSARLTLAEVLLEAHDGAEALQLILSGLDHLVQNEQLDSLWRAYVIAARARQQLNDVPSAREYASKAREVLVRQERVWGANDFQQYLKRHDVSSLLRTLQTLPA
jgi:serine/threonine protein kinase/lipopolysaccharide biosynthesis regulator YciM